MIHGMTGFGSRSFAVGEKKYNLTIKTFNHKYLDSIVNVASGMSGEVEAVVKKEIAKFISRGRVIFHVSRVSSPMRKLVIDNRLLTDYVSSMKKIARKHNIAQGVTVSDIVSLPDVVHVEEIVVGEDKKFITSLRKASNKALKDLTSLRKREGEAICIELSSRVRSIHQNLSTIKKSVQKITSVKKRKLRGDEFREFLKDYNIAEEIKRLEFHIKTFSGKLKGSGPLGKMLDFIAQEMQREINTLSAKFRESKILYASVLIKDEIEKIREQLQNVE